MTYADAAYIVSSRTWSERDLAQAVTPAGSALDLQDAATQAAIGGACAAAAAEIDSALRVIFSGTLPLADPPELVRKANAVLACYELWQSGTKDPDNNPFRAQAKTTRQWLSDLVAGNRQIDLGESDGGQQGVPNYDSARGRNPNQRQWGIGQTKELL